MAEKQNNKENEKDIQNPKKQVKKISSMLNNLNDEIISLFGLYSVISPYDSLANSLKQSFNQVLEYVDDLKDFASKQNFSNMPDMIQNMWNFYKLNVEKILSLHSERLKLLSFNKDKQYKKFLDNIIGKYKNINNLSKEILNFNF